MFVAFGTPPEQRTFLVRSEAGEQDLSKLADLDALDTLPPREFAAGYAEVVKYGLIDDEPYFHWLEANRREIFEGGPARAEAIAHASNAMTLFVPRRISGFVSVDTGKVRLETILIPIDHTPRPQAALDAAVHLAETLACPMVRFIALHVGREEDEVDLRARCGALRWTASRIATRASAQRSHRRGDAMTQDLLESREGGIATLTMNRPAARNALTRDMIEAMAEALPRLAADPEVRLVVLTGAGGAFCSGGDVKGFARNVAGGSGAAAPMSFDHKVSDLRERMEVTRWLHEMPKPTLAVIPGPAAGAGLSLALACDLRIAADEAKLTTAFSKVGLSGDFGGSFFLSHLVGAAKARELYFTAQVLRGDEARQLGIVHRAVPAAELAAAAGAWAAELAALPTIAVGYMKRNLNATLRGASLAEVLDSEAIHMIRTFETDDHKGAAVAFVEKRAPSFNGR